MVNWIMEFAENSQHLDMFQQHKLSFVNMRFQIWHILKETPLTWIRMIKLWMKSGMAVNLNLGLYYDWGRIQAHILTGRSTHGEGLGEHLQTVSLTPCRPTFSSLYTKLGTLWIATATQINLNFTLNKSIKARRVQFAKWFCPRLEQPYQTTHLVWGWKNLVMNLVC